MILDIFGTFSDLMFVVHVIAVVIIITWLYTTTRGNSFFFAAGLMIVAYLLLAYPWALYPIFVVAFVFFVMGGQLQFVLDFGVAGILQILGFHEGNSEETRYQKLQQRVYKGVKLSEEDIQFMQRHAKLQAQGEAEMSNFREREDLQQRGAF
jgi:hypothetical protein